MMATGQALTAAQGASALLLFFLVGANLVILVAARRLGWLGGLSPSVRRLVLAIAFGLGWSGLFISIGAANPVSFFGLLGVFLNAVAILLVVIDAALSLVRKAPDDMLEHDSDGQTSLMKPTGGNDVTEAND